MFQHELPDITSNSLPATPSTLNWVGMEGIAVPISLCLSEGNVGSFSASASVYVSLDAPEAKGIHMSRLHKLVNKLAEIECNHVNIVALLDSLIQSQGDISRAAKIVLNFDLVLDKPALLSEESGYQSYPVVVSAEKIGQEYRVDFELTVAYSSTCPCSASLSRQLYAQAIDTTFNGSTIDKKSLLEWIQSSAGSIATPHSQRSYAYIKLTLDDEWPNLPELVTRFENSIGTPVQTAVKRTDEQAFAKLNAENLMFCEDAARRIKQTLETMSFVKDYWFKVEHRESLHAHNAVVIDRK